MPFLAIALVTTGCSSAQQPAPDDQTASITASGGPPRPTAPSSLANSAEPAVADTAPASSVPGQPADPSPTVALASTVAAQGDSGDLGAGDAVMPTLTGLTVAQARTTMSPTEVTITDLSGGAIDGPDGQIVCRQIPEPNQPVKVPISLAVADTC